MGLNELSRAAGVSASYLSAIEQNKRTIHLLKLCKNCQSTQCPFSGIFQHGANE